MLTDSSEVDQEMTPLGSNLAENVESIIRKLILNESVVFKSQQRNEAEPNETEKYQIANSLFEKNPCLFLIKFGQHLSIDELNYFDDVAKTDGELKILLKNLKSDVKNKEKLYKNRRFEKLKLLIEENKYFSEVEMMKRNPILYEQLIGQYLTEEEKKSRNRFNIKEEETSFVNVLMEGIEREQIEKNKKELEAEYENNFDSSNDSSDVSLEENASCGHWGEFNNAKVDKITKWGEFEPSSSQSQIKNCFDTFKHSKNKDSIDLQRQMNSVSVSKPSCNKNKGPKWLEFANHNQKRVFNKPNNFISAEERNLLREEFISTMYDSFLDGKDDFDYSIVDNDTSYDNLDIVNSDLEEKYFDSEEPELVDNENDVKMQEDENISEDELDIYMSALNKHPTICQLSKDIKKL